MTTVTTKTAIEEAANIFERSSGLDRNQAKLIAYWTLATHGLEELDRFPILIIQGPYGTGKSTTALCAGLMSRGFSGKLTSGHISEARIRDSFPLNGTIAIDEAESASEKFFINRYERMTSEYSVNRSKGSGEFQEETIDLFGAAILTRRQPLFDMSVLSRCVVVVTKRGSEYGSVTKKEAVKAGKQLLEASPLIHWDEIPMGLGRERDPWAPLLLAAEAFEDSEWLGWAETQIELAREQIELGHKFELRSAVYGAILAMTIDAFSDQVLDRVKLKDLRKHLAEEGHELTSNQVSTECRTMGFDVENAGGQMYVFTGGIDQVLSIADEIEYQDPWIDDRRQGNAQDSLISI